MFQGLASNEIKYILSKDKEDRTDSEIHKLFLAVKANKYFKKLAIDKSTELVR